MREVQRRIARNDSGADTQQLQDAIVARLQVLIENEGQRGGGQAGAATSGAKTSAPQQKAAQKSGAKPGETRRVESNVRTPKGLGAVSKTAERPTSNKPAKPDMEEMNSLIRDGLWGQLPEREREQMLQHGRFEKFLPKYESMIEDYFRRLAEANDETMTKPK
jgi:hypothetical protein